MPQQQLLEMEEKPLTYSKNPQNINLSQLTNPNPNHK